MSHKDTRPVVGEDTVILSKGCASFGTRLTGRTQDNSIQEAQKMQGFLNGLQLKQLPPLNATTIRRRPRLVVFCREIGRPSIRTSRLAAQRT